MKWGSLVRSWPHGSLPSARSPDREHCSILHHGPITPTFNRPLFSSNSSTSRLPQTDSSAQLSPRLYWHAWLNRSSLGSESPFIPDRTTICFVAYQPRLNNVMSQSNSSFHQPGTRRVFTAPSSPSSLSHSSHGAPSFRTLPNITVPTRPSFKSLSINCLTSFLASKHYAKINFIVRSRPWPLFSPGSSLITNSLQKLSPEHWHRTLPNFPNIVQNACLQIRRNPLISCILHQLTRASVMFENLKMAASPL